IEQCGKKGVRNIVIVSGGFKEVGNEELESQIVEIARQNGIRIIGPNCIGIYDAITKVETFFQSHDRMVRPSYNAKTKISFLTQSGTYGASFLELLDEDGLGVSKFVSYGNKADVNETDMLQYLAEDQDTKVIAIYLEAIGRGEGRTFFEVAKEVTRKKPVVIYKTGTTTEGTTAAKSHTGHLSSQAAVYNGVFKQTGILSIRNFDELLAVSKALAFQPLPKGNRCAFVSNGIGPVIAMIDEAVKNKLEIAKLQELTREHLREKFPPFFVIENPVDVTGSATSKDYEIAIEAFLNDPNVDIVMPWFVFQDTPLDENIVNVLDEMNSRTQKPILIGAHGGPYTKRMSKIIQGKGIPVFDQAGKVIAAASALYRYSQYLSR
ncbi:CoA-binding protein, partial [Candidatus Borrarchaeum sp.]|uniref:CoA-binding protein n=1 Tax=Candidatus Borrarchaeum sp. TaxID=2846742 RepID=UPI00257A8AB6